MNRFSYLGLFFFHSTRVHAALPVQPVTPVNQETEAQPDLSARSDQPDNAVRTENVDAMVKPDPLDPLDHREKLVWPLYMIETPKKQFSLNAYNIFEVRLEECLHL